MNKLRQSMSECSSCVSGARKVHFSPLVRTVLISRLFRSVVVFDNAIDRPTIIEMETKRKLFLTATSKSMERECQTAYCPIQMHFEEC